MLDFGEGILSDTELLTATVAMQLDECAEAHGLPPPAAGPIHLRLHGLIRALHIAAGERVVVLVDEYDKPILDHLHQPERALELREGLRNLYSVFKSQDARLRFVLLTGVSKFSKVSLFSGLNNLKDITLDERFATLCGYTQAELERAFVDWLDGVDLAEVRQWYNGYNFLGESVYNPFDVLLYLDNRQFRSYWFETGTPTFLINLLKARRYPLATLDALEVGENLLSSFDVGCIEPETLLFQTGYLTVRERIRQAGRIKYRLGYPNQEVRMSLNDVLLNQLLPDIQRREQAQNRIFTALDTDDPDALRQAFHAFFASIPHDWHRRNDIADYEGYWASIVYCYFAALGLTVIPEDVTHHGRIDLTILWAGRAWLLEFKVVELSEPGRALGTDSGAGLSPEIRRPAAHADRHGVQPGRTQSGRLRMAAANLTQLVLQTIQICVILLRSDKKNFINYLESKFSSMPHEPTASSPFSWQNWTLRQWSEAFFRHFFEYEDEDTPVTRLVITDATWHAVTGDASTSPDEMQQAFLNRFPRTRRELDHHLSGQAIRFLLHDFFPYLILTCLVAVASEENAEAGQFPMRLYELLGMRGDSPLPFKGLGDIWEELADQLTAGRNQGRPWRELVLPDPGIEVHIGYSKRLAFPSRKDQEKLAPLLNALNRSQWLDEPPVYPVLNIVEPHLWNFSTAFREEFRDFKKLVTSGQETAAHPFWAAVLGVLRANPQGSRTSASRQTLDLLLLMEFDEFDEPVLSLLSKMSSPWSSIVSQPLDLTIAGYDRLLVADEDPGEPARRLLSGGLSAWMFVHRCWRWFRTDC